ncbi:hypothetical protein CRUP_028666 [Coryphaenoides rupestris]|nr:hypothetical protein CRUP_028666 [Coryphaenoides rupestris]
MEHTYVVPSWQPGSAATTTPTPTPPTPTPPPAMPALTGMAGATATPPPPGSGAARGPTGMEMGPTGPTGPPGPPELDRAVTAAVPVLCRAMWRSSRVLWENFFLQIRLLLLVGHLLCRQRAGERGHRRLRRHRHKLRRRPADVLWKAEKERLAAGRLRGEQRQWGGTPPPPARDTGFTRGCCPMAPASLVLWQEPPSSSPCSGDESSTSICTGRPSSAPMPPTPCTSSPASRLKLSRYCCCSRASGSVPMDELTPESKLSPLGSLSGPSAGSPPPPPPSSVPPSGPAAAPTPS